MGDEPQVPREADEKGLGRSTALVSGATMLSRVLGLVREQMLAALVGATPYADAFVVAFRIPNLFRDLFAEGVLSAAFVPTFTDALRNRGREEAFRLANAVIGLVLLVVGAITVLGIVFAPEVMTVVASGFEGHKRGLTVVCTQLLFPFLPLVSLAAVAMGQLNAQEKYAPSALAPAAFNVVAIAGGAYLLVSGVHGDGAVIGWAIAMLFGGATQLAVQLPALWRTGFRFRPVLRFADPGIRRIGALMAPATVGLAATHVNILVSTYFASQQEGANAWLSYAFRFIYLPIGVFGVAVGTVTTAKLARRAADRDMAGVSRTVSESLRLVAFLTIPSMFGLIALREPVIRVVFERGAFTPQATQATAAAVLMYAVGLYAYSAIKVAAPAFYALNRPKVTVVASVSAVVVNLVLSITLFPRFGYLGLAFGTAAAAMVNFAVLATAFQRMVGGLDVRGLLGHFGRVCAAGLVSGIVAWGAHAAWDRGIGHDSLVTQIVAVVTSVLAGVLAYAAACKVTGVPELHGALAFLRRRSRRTKAE